MHELGIASEILEAVGQALATRPGLVATRVRLTVGRRRNVDFETLRFAFEALARDEDRFRAARLELEEECPVFVCRSCRLGGALEGYAEVCPACGRMDLDVSGGDEIVLRSIDAEEADARAPA